MMPGTRSTAIHEAGHVVAHWHLDRVRFLGYMMPQLHRVTVALDGGSVQSDGNMGRDLAGVVESDPCVWISPAGEPVISLEAIPPGARDRFKAAWRRGASADIVVSMAGPLAECLHEGEPLTCSQPWLWDYGDGEAEFTDEWQIEARIPLLGRRWRLHLDRAFMLADRIVREHQPEITTLADALLVAGSLTGDQAAELLR